MFFILAKSLLSEKEKQKRRFLCFPHHFLIHLFTSDFPFSKTMNTVVNIIWLYVMDKIGKNMFKVVFKFSSNCFMLSMLWNITIKIISQIYYLINKVCVSCLVVSDSLRLQPEIINGLPLKIHLIIQKSVNIVNGF